MDLHAIVQGIDDAIMRLQQARSLLTGHTPPLKRGLPPTEISDRPQQRTKIRVEERARPHF
jgi:hypothetical protein